MSKLFFRYAGPPRTGPTRMLSEIQREPGDDVVLLGPEVTKQWYGTIRDPHGQEHAIRCDEKTKQCVLEPKKEVRFMNEAACCKIPGVTDGESRLLHEHFPEMSPASFSDARFRSVLLRQIALDHDTDGRRMVDDAARPRAGETAGDAICRRHREHTARMKLEGRPSLTFSEFLEEDRVVHEGLYLLHESEQAGPELERAERVSKYLSEIDRHAKPLMKNGVSLGAARAKAMAEDRGLAARYTAAVMGLPEPVEE